MNCDGGDRLGCTVSFPTHRCDTLEYDDGCQNFEESSTRLNIMSVLYLCKNNRPLYVHCGHCSTSVSCMPLLPALVLCCFSMVTCSCIAILLTGNVIMMRYSRDRFFGLVDINLIKVSGNWEARIAVIHTIQSLLAVVFVPLIVCIRSFVAGLQPFQKKPLAWRGKQNVTTCTLSAAHFYCEFQLFVCRCHGSGRARLLTLSDFSD